MSFSKKLNKIFERIDHEGNLRCDDCDTLMWDDAQPEEVKSEYPNEPKRGRRFMARNNVWKKVMKNDSNKEVCLSDFEKRMGRKAEISDFDFRGERGIINKNIQDDLDAAENQDDGPLY